MNEELIRKIVKEELASQLGGYVFSKQIQLLDGRNIVVGTSTGTKIGTASTQKLSVFGVTPVVQAGAITAPSGGATQDAESRTAIGSIITALHNFGIIA